MELIDPPVRQIFWGAFWTAPASAARRRFRKVWRVRKRCRAALATAVHMNPRAFNGADVQMLIIQCRPGKSLYIRRPARRFAPAMDGYDMNWWGVYAMPVGVALCFGPVLVAWALAECKKEAPAPQKKK